MKFEALFFLFIVLYAVLQMIFNSIWIFITGAIILSFTSGFYFGIACVARLIKEGKVKLP